MKRILIFACIVSACMLTMTGCKRVVTSEELPAAAQTFISERFPEAEVIYATKEGGEYEVRLSNGLELEFNARGICKDIDD